MIAHAMKEIREREREQQKLIRAMCARLGEVQLDGLLEAIDDLPSQKKIDELEAKNTFLHKKSKKVSEELKEEKEAHQRWTSSISPSPSTRSWRPTSDILETWSTRRNSSTPTWPRLQSRPER